MAVSTNTVNRLQLGVGDLLWNDVDLGATGRDGQFGVEQDIHWPELGGAKGPIAGTGWIIREIATLQTQVKEWTIDKMTYVMPALTCGSDGSSEYTLTPNVGYIASTAHKTVKWQGELANGKEAHIELYQALPQPGLTRAFNDQEESGIEVTYQSYYQASAVAQRSWKMLIQK